MKSLEKNMVTQATLQDLDLIELIILKIQLYDCEYGNLEKYKLGLRCSNYSTVKVDFLAFKTDIVKNNGRYSVRELSHLKRSLQLIRDVYQQIFSNENNLFINFLNDSILNIDEWQKEVIEAIIFHDE